MRTPVTSTRWTVLLLMSVTLLGVPVLPAIASAPPDVAAHAMHADHGKADMASDVKGGNVSSCLQHDPCGGKCCATCAQCFTAAFNFSIASLQTYSVQFPTVLYLDDRLTVAAHNRPPTV